MGGAGGSFRFSAVSRIVGVGEGMGEGVED